MNSWVIYALLCPMTGAVRYIGQAKNPRHRFTQHLRMCRTETSRKARWIATLLDDDQEPVQKILESGSGDGWKEAECRWIAHYRSIGADLTNLTNGGDGTPGNVRSEESKRKIAEILRGRKRPRYIMDALRCFNTGRQLSPEQIAKRKATIANKSPEEMALWRARIAAAGVGRKRSPESIAKVVAAHLGTKRSPESRARMSAAAKGKIISEETRKKMSQAHKGKRLPDSAYAKSSAALLGKPKSAEHRLKLSIAKKLYYQQKKEGEGQ